ncbi:hypothetical protein [Arthrobacter sp. SLBN-100]|uniref:hypothetical protein n=1 Tax=Arthrobacter sp. SLBN-100 TaxID=2768450 RepID=UPI00114FC30E|nr:hypothetical protein [Arthrobacter sp. SLBN-100]
MLVKRLVLAGAGAAIILSGTAMIFDNLAHEQPATGAGTAASPGQGPVADGLAPAGTGGTSAPPQGGPGTAESGGNASFPEADGAGGSGGQGRLEVLPPASASPTGLPVPSPAAALVSAPLPAPASAQGKTVEGFPSQVLSFPDGTVIVFTGVSSSGDTLQATAEGIVELAPEKVTGHFQQVLQSAGFRSEEAPAAVGQQGLRLTRGNDSVSVTLSVTGTGSTRFSLLGNFHTEPGR